MVYSEAISELQTYLKTRMRKCAFTYMFRRNGISNCYHSLWTYSIKAISCLCRLILDIRPKKHIIQI